VLTVS